MGHAFNESYVEFGSTRKINFCNKLFTAWDFNITDPKTAKLRQAHIRTDFHVIMININMCAIFCCFLQEELLDLQAREEKRSWKELFLVIFIRFWTNLFVILTLVGAGAAIYYSAAYELQIVSLMATASFSPSLFYFSSFSPFLCSFKVGLRYLSSVNTCLPLLSVYSMQSSLLYSNWLLD